MRTRADILDELLVLRVQRGEKKALELLVKRWQGVLYNRALYLSRDPEAAHDIVQEVWIGVIRGIRRIQDPSRFGPWIHRMLRNKCADWIRQQQSDRRMKDSASEAIPTEPATTGNTEFWVNRLREAIRDLPDEHKTILTLFYLDEISVREIAAMLNVPDGTVKSRLFNARKRLKETMED